LRQLFNNMKLSRSDLILFTKRLSFLLGASISVQQAMSIVTAQSRKKIQPIFTDISTNINHGRSMSESFALFPHSFPIYMVKIIKAGEESGQLKQSFLHVSQEIQRRKTLSTKLIGSCVYPAIIAIGTLLLSGFLIFFIFPKIKTLFKGMNAQMPMSTRFLMWFSEFLQKYGLLLFIIIFIFLSIIYYLLRTRISLQLKKDKALLRTPLIGKLLSLYLLSTIFRTTGIMLKASIPIHKALRYASESIAHKEYQHSLQVVSENVLSGQPISKCLSVYQNLYPDLTIQLIEVGEASGTLSDTLIYLSEILDQEIDDSLKVLMGVIEPTLMAVMGIVVGFISLSIITPIYAITQNINK
jgi:type II secretory pathway component PulF